jgi:hypothetical protein
MRAPLHHRDSGLRWQAVRFLSADRFTGSRYPRALWRSANR